MYIQKDSLRGGYNVYLAMGRGKGRSIGMDVGLLLLEAGEEYAFCEREKETALLLFAGEIDWTAGGETRLASRESEFSEQGSCLHVCAGTRARARARSRCEIYIQRVRNEREFAPVFYAPPDIRVQRAGVSELQGTMRRDIKTVFDYENAPYSNMVLGEVLNFPGKWSSYPPHHHPQPEVYFYRFDRLQGFGAGFANGDVHRIGHNGLLVIEHGFHSQAAAPGYGLCYVWGIRHLPRNPWQKTRIDDEAHTWMLRPGAEMLRDAER